jgi:hypothetical protein
MSGNKMESCEDCGSEVVLRAWSTQWRTGKKFGPVRRRALRFCTNRACPRSRSRGSGT